MCDAVAVCLLQVIAQCLGALFTKQSRICKVANSPKALVEEQVTHFWCIPVYSLYTGKDLLLSQLFLTSSIENNNNSHTTLCSEFSVFLKPFLMKCDSYLLLIKFFILFYINYKVISNL